MKGQEIKGRLDRIGKTTLEHFQDIKELEVADEQLGVTVEYMFPYKCEQVEKSLKAIEILKRNVKVSIDYGEEKYISMALVFYIDNKKTIYVVDEAIKEQNPEHFKELELLKEVLE